MKNTLLVYYSYSGVTRKIVREMAKTTNCDIEEIHEQKLRATGIRGFFEAAIESLTKKTPPIEELYHQLNQYDHIVIGTPVWAGHIASPIRSFLKNNRNNIKSASFFSTYGTSGGIQVLNEMAELIDQPAKSSFAFSGEMIQNPNYLDKRISNFVSSWPTIDKLKKETTKPLLQPLKAM